MIQFDEYFFQMGWIKHERGMFVLAPRLLNIVTFTTMLATKFKESTPAKQE